MSNVKRDRAWLTQDSKRILKMRAAKKGLTLMQYLDDLAKRQEKEKKKGGDFGFF